MARVQFLIVIWLAYFQHTTLGILAKFNPAMVAPTSNRDLKTTFINESVPKECEESGFCEVSKRYPKELVRNLIRELEVANMTMDSDVDEMTFENRFGDYSRKNPCQSKSTTIIPLMVRGYIDGQWYYTVNSIDNPIQKYRIQKCVRGNSAANGNTECIKQLILKDDYKSQCIQKSITRRTFVVLNNTAVPILVDIPCCCTCVAVDRYENNAFV